VAWQWRNPANVWLAKYSRAAASPWTARHLGFAVPPSDLWALPWYPRKGPAQPITATAETRPAKFHVDSGIAALSRLEGLRAIPATRPRAKRYWPPTRQMVCRPLCDYTDVALHRRQSGAGGGRASGYASSSVLEACDARHWGDYGFGSDSRPRASVVRNLLGGRRVGTGLTPPAQCASDLRGRSQAAGRLLWIAVDPYS